MKRGRILIVTQMYPSGSTGTSVKTLYTIRFLAKEGFIIDICCPHYHKMVKIPLTISGVTIYPFEKQTTGKFSFAYLLRAWKSLFSWKPFRAAKLYDRVIDTTIQALRTQHRYDYIFFDGFSTIQYTKMLDESHIYIDDEDITDLMWQRTLTTPNYLLRIFYAIEWMKCLLYERIFFRRVKEIWAISPNTKKRLQTLSNAKTSLMPTIVPSHQNVFHNQSKHIIFSGLLSWQENVVGLKWFLANCWDTIHASLPDTHLYITGQMADQDFAQYIKMFPHVTLLGFIPNLTSVYNRCALAIAPIFTNAGIKVKILTYLSFGLPVVANAEATWGMTSTDGIILSEKNQFTDSIIHLLADQNLRTSLSKKGKNNMTLHHSEKSLRTFFTQRGILV